MEVVTKNMKGLLLCLLIAVPAWFLGTAFPIIGGPVIAIILGMIVTLFIKDKSSVQDGINYSAKKILQYAVILLGFGLNLSVILDTGKQSLPIIICTIATSLILAYFLSKVMHIPARIATLVGVGSSICGGSAIAATAPVIDADDEEVAQAISVIFFFNVLAAVIFPHFEISWDLTRQAAKLSVFLPVQPSMTLHPLQLQLLPGTTCLRLICHPDKAVTVKLTRTLAIIPITLVLALYRTKKEKSSSGSSVSLKKIFPFFIIYFIVASIITTVATNVFGISAEFFAPIKELSKFFIVVAMAAIGLNTNIVKLVKTGGKPIILGLCCWVGITAVSLILQHVLGIW